MKRLRSILRPKHSKDELPHKIIQNRIYILPTKSGMLFCFMLFVMFLVSLNNNNNLGILITFLLGAMFLISMIYTHSNLIGLKITGLNSSPVFNGENVEIICSVFSANLTRPLVSFNIQGQNKTNSIIKEENNQQIIIKAENIDRGKYKPKLILIETEFPFSFFKAWTYVMTDIECLIYPKPIANSNPNIYIEESTDTVSGTKSIKGNEDFDGLKIYQAGDSLKQIFWKGYSKGGGLHSKTYSGGASDTLLFDFDSLGSIDIEKKLSMLCYNIITANQNGTKFALKLPNKFIAANTGELHKNNCLQALALFGDKNA